MTFTFADPTEWWLEIPPHISTESWEASKHYATLESRWSAHLNRLCLTIVLSWIQAEYAAEAATWTDSIHLPAFWDVVNGAAIKIGAKRLVLIPTEAIDSELEVPQEWIDIPSWASDYYLAVHIQPDRDAANQWVRVWGYTTHKNLKSIGRYDPDDRTYCMDRQALTLDMSTLWATIQFCPEEQTKLAIAPLPELSPAHAETLLQRLGQATIAFPRLVVPFTLWGALVEQDTWRQRLYLQRTQQGQIETQAAVALSQWLQGQVTAGWRSLETVWGAGARTLAASFRSGLETYAEDAIKTKQIELTTSPDPQDVLLLIALGTEPDERVKLMVQLHPNQNQAYVPANLTLSLLSEMDDVLQSVQAGEQDDYIQLRPFRCPADTRFSLQIVLDECVVTEQFIT